MHTGENSIWDCKVIVKQSKNTSSGIPFVIPLNLCSHGFPYCTILQVRANCLVQLLQDPMGLIFHMGNLWPAEEKWKMLSRSNHPGLYPWCLWQEKFLWTSWKPSWNRRLIWHFSVSLVSVYNWQFTISYFE